MDNEYLRLDNEENKKDKDISSSSFSNIKQKVEKKDNYSFFDLFTLNISKQKETFKPINTKTARPNILIPSIIIAVSIIISLFLLLITYITKNFNFVLATYIFTIISIPLSFIFFSRSFETRGLIKGFELPLLVFVGFGITFISYLLDSYLLSKVSSISYVYEFLSNALNIILLSVGLFIVLLIKKNISHFAAILIASCLVAGFILCNIGFNLFYSLSTSIRAFGIIGDSSKSVSAIITTNIYNEQSVNNFCSSFFINALYKSFIIMLSINLIAFYFNYALTDLDLYFKAFQISPTIMIVFIIFIYLLSSVSSFASIVSVVIKIICFFLLSFLNIYIIDFNCKNEKFLA